MRRKFKIQLNTLKPLPRPFPPDTYTLEHRFYMTIKSSTSMEDVHNIIRENLHSFFEGHRIDIGDSIKIIED